MQKLKRVSFVISVLILVLCSSFNAFALSLLKPVPSTTFLDGPWTSNKAAVVGVKSDGSTSAVSLPQFDDASGWYKFNYVASSTYPYYDIVLHNSNSFVNNMIIYSEKPLQELIVVDQYNNQHISILGDALIANVNGDYFYGISVYNGMGVEFRTTGVVYVSEFSPAFGGSGRLYDVVMENMPFLGGVYDSGSVAVRYPGLVLDGTITPRTPTYGFNYAVFPLVLDKSSFGKTEKLWKFNDAGGVLHSDSQYSFNFKVQSVPSGGAYIGDDSEYIPAVVNDDNYSVTVNGKDVSLASLTLSFVAGTSKTDWYVFKYLSSSSDDVGSLPPDDSGGGAPDYSSALGQIGNSLNKLMGAVGSGTTTIVNNITNQTTQITNTITNTVTNMTQQITQGLSDVKQGITDKLQGVQQGITDKLGQVQEGINSKLDDVQDEIVNGYDNTGITQENEKLEQSLNQYDEVESGIFEDAEGFIGDFEYPSVDSLPLGIIKALAFVGSFLQGIFLCMGEFSVIITFSLTMIFVMVVVGYHRIRS